jgi:amino acid transporter
VEGELAPRPVLGPVALFSLGVNGIVGVGIFVAPPTVAAAIPGARGALAYLAVALACLPIALTYARLARAMPADGGPVLYATHAFGARIARAIGVLIWVSALFSTAAVTRALADLAARTIERPGLAPWFAGAIVAILVLVNARGLRLSAYAWTVLTALKLAPLILIAALGAIATARTGAAPPADGSLGRALLAILFALQGFEIVALPAGQARDAERTVPRATVAALVAAGALYAAIHLGCARALPDLAHEGTPIVSAAATLGGRALSRGVSIGVAASILGIVVGMHAMTPRYLTAFTGPSAAVVDLRAILVSAAIVAPLAVLGSLPGLVDLSSAAVLTQYAATAVALLVLAARRREGLSPRDLWPAPLALVVVVVLLLQVKASELGVAIGVAILGGAIASRMAPRLPRDRDA